MQTVSKVEWLWAGYTQAYSLRTTLTMFTWNKFQVVESLHICVCNMRVFSHIVCHFVTIAAEFPPRQLFIFLTPVNNYRLTWFDSCLRWQPLTVERQHKMEIQSRAPRDGYLTIQHRGRETGRPVGAVRTSIGSSKHSEGNFNKLFE